MSENSTPQESWNMATATLKRLSWLLDQCSIASQTGDMIRWFNVLMDLRRNLSPFMENTYYNDIMNDFKELPQNWKTEKKDWGKVNSTLDKIFIKFIKLMKKNGLLMPKAIDSGQAVIQM